MARREIMIISLFLACLPIFGCFNSESDYQQLIEEKESSKANLAAAAKENEILAEALQNINKEHETLQILANIIRSNISAEYSTGAPSSVPLQPLTGDPQIVSSGGWEWAIPPDAFSNGNNEQGNIDRASSPSPSGRTYRPKAGDVLSSIASRHNTTVSELIKLNPYLQNRRNYMIWDTDVIQLP